MEPQAIRDRLSEAFPEAVGELDVSGKDPFVIIQAERIVDVCQFARDTEGLEFNYLSNLGAVDAGENLGVVYHLFSLQHKHTLVLKVFVPRQSPHVPTVEGVWPAANWMEREAWDLMGIVFDGHPDLRRLLLPEQWEGHPLQKDYQEKHDYKGIPTTRPDMLERFERYDEIKAPKAEEPSDA
jgi:NADH-quinone oxidoreductase subunit C